MTVLTDRERWRVLDANGNRLREGLRVIEEVYRFCDAQGGASVGRRNGTSCSRGDTNPSVDVAAETGGSSAAIADQGGASVAPPATLAELKALRHRAAELLKELPYAELLAARDTDGDAGKALPGALNAARGDVRDLLRANFARAGEAARVLEEFGAGWNPEWSGRARALRFDIYRLEKGLGLALADGPG